MILFLKKYIKIISLLTISLFSCYLTSIYYKNKINKIILENNNKILQIENNNKENEILIKKQTEKILLKNEELNLKLKKTENELYLKFKEKNKKNEKILNNITNGNTRLFINTKATSCDRNENNTTTSMDDGKTERREFDREVSKNLINLINEADYYKNQLESLQDWVNDYINNKNNGV